MWAALAEQKTACLHHHRSCSPPGPRMYLSMKEGPIHTVTCGVHSSWARAGSASSPASCTSLSILKRSCGRPEGVSGSCRLRDHRDVPLVVLQLPNLAQISPTSRWHYPLHHATLYKQTRSPPLSLPVLSDILGVCGNLSCLYNKATAQCLWYHIHGNPNIACTGKEDFIRWLGGGSFWGEQ